MRIGTFIKTPAPHVMEVLGYSGLDFAVLDAEHGPFDRSTADQMMLGSRAADLPMLIRIPDMNAATILWALDIGAAAIVVPHVDTGEEAALLVSRARFVDGTRGFSNAGRFARYGTTNLKQAVALGDRAEIYCQIESADAVANINAIISTPGVDGIIVGRADLALSLGETTLDAPAVLDATRSAFSAAREAGKQAVIVAGAVAELPPFLDMGATMVIVGSDQSLMRAAAKSVVEDLKSLLGR